jgi:8-oxo-dGTP pyrophosphatase MutT (NUDIX family)
MLRKNGPWTVEVTTRKYQNAWIEVDEDRVITPSGRAGTFTTVRMKPGISVLAMDGEGVVYLTAEFRYAIGRESLEVVSGAIDGDESPLTAAKRELREELGIEAAEWLELGVTDPFTSVIHSPARLFLARNLSFTEPQCEPTELIRPLRMKLDEAVRMVFDSGITHGPSCVLILKAHLYLAEEHSCANREVGQ